MTLEPVFATLFARLLAEVHPPLADCLAIAWWKGGDTALAGEINQALERIHQNGTYERIARKYFDFDISPK